MKRFSFSLSSIAFLGLLGSSLATEIKAEPAFKVKKSVTSVAPWMISKKVLKN